MPLNPAGLKPKASGATILLASSVFHFNIISIKELKADLKDRGV